MLNIQFGAHPDEIASINDYFDTLYDSNWLKDPFIKEMILAVDNVDVKSPHCLISNIIGEISVFWLSGGLKTLILLYTQSNIVVDGSNCGDNCAEWILKIAEKKDITVAYHNIMKFPCDFTAYILNTKEYIHTYKEYVFLGVDLI